MSGNVYDNIGWFKLTGPSIAPQFCFWDTVNGTLAAIEVSGNVVFAQYWTPSAGWSAILGGSYPGAGSSGNFQATSRLVGNGVVAYGNSTTVSGAGQLWRCDQTGVYPLGPSWQYYTVPGYLSRALPAGTMVLGPAQGGQGALWINRYWPQLVFAWYSPQGAGNGQFLIGFNATTGLPVIVVPSDLSTFNFAQSGDGPVITNGAQPGDLFYPGNGAIPGAALYFGGNYSAAALDFYDLPLQYNSLAISTLETLSSSLGGQVVTGIYPINVFRGALGSTAYFPTYATSLTDPAWPVHAYTGYDLVKLGSTLAVSGGAVVANGVCGANATAFATYNGGGTLQDMTYYPFPGGLPGLPITLAPPAGFNGTPGSFSYGVLGTGLYILDTSGNFYGLGFFQQSYHGLFGDANWTHPYPA